MEKYIREISTKERNTLLRENMVEKSTCSFTSKNEDGTKHQCSGDTLSSLYVNVIEKILYGSSNTLVTESGTIKELYSGIFTISEPKNALILVGGRGISPAFCVAETLWNIAADKDCWLATYNHLYKKYFTNSSLTSGYGNRIFNWNNSLNQFERVAEMLSINPNSQRALVTIFNPIDDMFLTEEKSFSPCIVNLHFKIRDNKLNLRCYMRAQDIWTGFPYDINLLLTIFQMMSMRLGIEMGTYEHCCDVVRLYEKNTEQAKQVHYLRYANKVDTCINLSNDYCYEDYVSYKNLVKDIDSISVDSLFGIPHYWSNAIKTCKAYKLVKQGLIAEALDIAKTTTNAYGELFYIWYDHWYDYKTKNAP